MTSGRTLRARTAVAKFWKRGTAKSRQVQIFNLESKA